MCTPKTEKRVYYFDPGDSESNEPVMAFFRQNSNDVLWDSIECKDGENRSMIGVKFEMVRKILNEMAARRIRGKLFVGMPGDKPRPMSRDEARAIRNPRPAKMRTRKVSTILRTPGVILGSQLPEKK